MLFKEASSAKPAFIWSKVQQKQYNFKIFFIILNNCFIFEYIFKCIYYCDFKAEF